MVPTSSTQNRHIPVMLMESLENLKIKKNGVYVEGTLGLGGHSEIILQQIDSGLLIGIDRDKDSISLSKKRLSSNNNFKLFNDSYQNLNIILEELKIQDYTAEDIIQKNELEELTRIFKEYGEERHAYKIAKKIKDLKGEISVLSITSIVDKVTPYKYRLKTYSRIFQALRIAANNELDHLSRFLDDFINLLNPGGRIVIISYHSVEDRIVKHKLKELKHKKEIELIYKKPLIPSKEEVSINKRSRSAKMRVGEKIG